MSDSTQLCKKCNFIFYKPTQFLSWAKWWKPCQSFGVFSHFRMVASWIPRDGTLHLWWPVLHAGPCWDVQYSVQSSCKLAATCLFEVIRRALLGLVSAAISVPFLAWRLILRLCIPVFLTRGCASHTWAHYVTMLSFNSNFWSSVSDSAGLRWGSSICISNKFPIAAAGLDHTLRTTGLNPAVAQGTQRICFRSI